MSLWFYFILLLLQVSALSLLVSHSLSTLRLTWTKAFVCACVFLLINPSVSAVNWIPDLLDLTLVSRHKPEVTPYNKYNISPLRHRDAWRITQPSQIRRREFLSPQLQGPTNKHTDDICVRSAAVRRFSFFKFCVTRRLQQRDAFRDALLSFFFLPPPTSKWPD